MYNNCVGIYDCSLCCPLLSMHLRPVSDNYLHLRTSMEELCAAMAKLSLSKVENIFDSCEDNSVIMASNSCQDRKIKTELSTKRLRCWKCKKFGHKKKFCLFKKSMRWKNEIKYKGRQRQSMKKKKVKQRLHKQK